VNKNRSLPFWPSRSFLGGMVLAALAPKIIFTCITYLFYRNLFQTNVFNSMIILSVTICLLAAYPCTLGVISSPSWRGFWGGVLAFLGMVIVFIGLYYIFVINNSFRAMASYLSGNKYSSIIYLFIISLVPISGILILRIVIYKEGKVLRFIHDILGTIMGILIAIIIFFFLSSMYLDITRDQLTFLVLDFPLLVEILGLTILTFSELLSRKTGWGGLLIWLVLLIAIFLEPIAIQMFFIKS